MGIHTTEYYLVLKEESLPLMIGMNLEEILPSKISLTQKDKYRTISP